MSRLARETQDSNRAFSIPGFTVDPSEPDFEPLLASKSDGVEYVGEYMVNVAMMGPLAVASRYPTIHPVTWLLKGLVLLPIMVVWILTAFVTLGLLGLLLSILGESWNSMRGRR